MRKTAVAKKNKHTRPFDPHKRKVTRADIAMPANSGKTAAQLQAEIDQAGPMEAPAEPPRRTVARRNIRVAEQVFQWRGDARRDRWNRENHIYTLAKAIKDNEKPLERLLVFPVGKDFYVIDGHHRLAAYDTAGWTKGIPVEVFAGTLAEARVCALACNVKDKLAMTAQAKSDAAWRIIKEDLGGLAAPQVMQLTGVSRRQVFYMKSVWKELNERDGINDEDRARLNDEDRASRTKGYRACLPQLTWKQACDMRDGKKPEMTDFDYDDWKYQKAEEVVDLIRKNNVAVGLLKDLGVTAIALRMLHEGLPERLIEEWASDHQELIEELAGRIANPDADDSDYPF
jgi:hypothetical protein